MLAAKIKLFALGMLAGFAASVAAWLVGAKPLFYYSVKSHKILILKLILELGENPNIQYNVLKMESPLTLAASSNDAEAAEILMQHGASLAWRGGDGTTPMEMAVLMGADDTLEVFLQNGGNANEIRSGPGRETLLMLAASLRNITIVRKLLAHGANIDPTDENGHNVFYYAGDDQGIIAELTKSLGRAPDPEWLAPNKIKNEPPRQP